MDFFAVSDERTCIIGAHSVLFDTCSSQSHVHASEKISRVTVKNSPSVARPLNLKGRGVREELTLTYEVETRELHACCYPHPIVCVPFVSSTLHALPPKWALTGTSHVRSEQTSSSQRNSPGSLDTTSLRSSSVPHATPSTRTPRHPLVSCEHAANRARIVQNMEHASSDHL